MTDIDTSEEAVERALYSLTSPGVGITGKNVTRIADLLRALLAERKALRGRVDRLRQGGVKMQAEIDRLKRDNVRLTATFIFPEEQQKRDELWRELRVLEKDMSAAPRVFELRAALGIDDD